MKNPTRFKLEEAEFYCEKVKDNYNNDPERRFYLSAFLAAARSVTDIMREQYKDIDGFVAWFDKKLLEWKNDKDLKFLKENRNENIHIRPTRTKTEATLRIAHIIQTIRENQETPIMVGDENNISSDKDKNIPNIIWWRFADPGNYDIPDFCEKQKDKLAKIVEECEKVFK